MRDLIEQHVGDLGCPSELSKAQRQLVKRAATLETALEQFDAKFASAEEASIDAYSRISGNLRRLLAELGLKRVPKQIDPVQDYLRRRREAEALAARDLSGSGGANA
jgi:hypothetical protein